MRDIFDEIKGYKDLLDQGVITQEEFDQKKAELLSHKPAFEDGQTVVNVTQQNDVYNVKKKAMNKHVFVWVCSFLFGGFGVDRFVRGQVGLGLLKLLTFGGCVGVWALIDWIIALTKVYGSAFGNEEDVTFINGKYAH